VIFRILKITGLFTGFAVVGAVSAYLVLTLIIKSEDTVVVPRLDGKEIVAVLKMLSDLKLNIKVSGAEYNEAVPLNHVIAQNPSAGTEIKTGRDVRVVISKGVQTVSVPDIRNMDAATGALLLAENGLCAGKRAVIYRRLIKADRIVEQTPPAGSRVQKGTCVDFLVSRGKRPAAYKMPDLGGILPEEAMLAIERYQLRLGEIVSVSRMDRPQNTVVDQSPPAGYRVLEGTVVDLKSNRTPPAGGGEPLRPVSGAGLLVHRTGFGFLKSRIRVNINWRGRSDDIFDEFVKPGRVVRTLIPKETGVRARLYVDGQLEKTLAY